MYKDKKGNVYQKLKGGTGYGEPIGISLNNLQISPIDYINAGVIIFNYFATPHPNTVKVAAATGTEALIVNALLEYGWILTL